MTVTVLEADLRHHAIINGAPCCEHGHPDAESAALHAWTLMRAIARHEAEADQAAARAAAIDG